MGILSQILSYTIISKRDEFLLTLELEIMNADLPTPKMHAEGVIESLLVYSTIWVLNEGAWVIYLIEG